MKKIPEIPKDRMNNRHLKKKSTIRHVCLFFIVSLFALSNCKKDDNDEQNMLLFLLLFLNSQQAEVVDCPSVDIDLLIAASPVITKIATFTGSLRTINARWSDGIISSFASSCITGLPCNQAFTFAHTPNTGVTISADVMVETGGSGSCTVIERNVALNKPVQIELRTTNTRVYAIVRALTNNGDVYGNFISF